MCGLAGTFLHDAAAWPDRDLLQRMTGALRHRGPDGEGLHVEPGIGLGHRRLAVIDPLGGEQPMSNEDGSVLVVFNGEIYNFEALREELQALGHVFRNRCDTEAIVHAWESWGPDCLTRFAGMFAFALWDRRQRTLFLARDRLGKKPLYLAERPGALHFASEMGALAGVPGIDRTIDPRALEAYLAWGYVPDPDTIYRGVRRLPPAHALLLRAGETPRPYRWWAPPAAARRVDAGEAAGELRRRLTRATAARLVADVPLGAFLSGGVDSGAVVATAAPLRTTPLGTFTIGFEGEEDETPLAALVSRRYGTLQHTERASATDMIEAARTAGALFGEPFGDSSAIPTATVCALARRHATVALSGDGGDEVFGGYRRYRWHVLVEGVRRFLPAGVRRQAIGRLAALYPKLDRAPRFLRARHTLTELSLESALGYARTMQRSDTAERRALMSAPMRAALPGETPEARIAALMAEAPDADPLLQAQLVDLQTWLAGSMLVKVDRASMAHSLEVRSPFLDHELVEWGLSLPAALKLAGGQGKRILKAAMEPLLPAEILTRRKQGFAAELGPLLRREQARLRARLLGAPMLDSGLFDPRAIATLIDEHVAGRRDRAQPLWLLLAFEGFLAAASGLAPREAMPAIHGAA
jgi:asparagine synthase (glutamine-hydrolysing)